jgi:hypothetical protein
MTDKAMRICDNKGFHLDLPNGVTVSVQFGPGNYCDSDVSNADFDAPKNVIGTDEMWGSNLAECAAYITGSSLTWVAVPGFTGPIGDDDSDTFYDDVIGHLNVQGVIDFINLASQLVPAANPNSLGNRMVASLERGDYRDDPKLQQDELDAMDEFQQEETDEA